MVCILPLFCLLFLQPVRTVDQTTTIRQELLECTDESQALSFIKAHTGSVKEAEVTWMVKHAWWSAVKAGVGEMRGAGVKVGGLGDLRNAVISQRDKATEIYNLLRQTNAEATSLSPAFQWAQSKNKIFINLKFSSRIDGPVTVLNVDNENITITNSSLHFDAIGRQKPKQFKLDLHFFEGVQPNASDWNFASVGRIAFTLAKAELGHWPRLLKAKTKMKNMYTWHDKQENLDKQQKKEDKDAKEAAKAEKEAAEKAEKDAKEKAASNGTEATNTTKSKKKKKAKKAKAEASKAEAKAEL